MLITIGTAKGSGATSTALLLASVWPRPAVLLEADPTGGDLAYRCRAAVGGANRPTNAMAGAPPRGEWFPAAFTGG